MPPCASSTGPAGTSSTPSCMEWRSSVSGTAIPGSRRTRRRAMDATSVGLRSAALRSRHTR
eukprot:10157912-Alexandrium_andersonii.AAC.1